jgi:hypothetical protein
MGADQQAEQAVQELLAVHEHERTAHLDAAVEALMENQADDFTYVGNGVIRHLTGVDMRRNVEAAFRNATYHEFDDLEPPVIRAASDGCFAWMMVRINVRKSQPDETGAMRERSFVSAGIRTYEKRNGRWLRTGTS